MSERNGYEHGVPSWIAGAHADPDQAAAFYTELFGWDAERRGEHLVCTLRGRDVAGFVRGDEPAWRTNVWVESADETAERAQAAGGSVVTAPFDVEGVGRTRRARRPRRRRLHRLRARPPPRRPGRQRARRVGDERALDARPRAPPTAFYGAVFGWETEAFGPATLWRLPGFVGGEPEQPVARDVVAVAMPGDRPAGTSDLWVDDPDAIAEQGRSARRHRADGPDGHADGPPRGPRRPAGRNVLGQPGDARMSTIEVVNHVTLDGVMQAPADPDEDRRGGFEHGGWAVALPRRRPGRVHGRADGPGRRRAAVRPLDLREDAERLDAAAGGQPGPAGARAQHEVRRLALGRPRRVDELGAPAGRRGRDRRATSRPARRATS